MHYYSYSNNNDSIKKKTLKIRLKQKAMPVKRSMNDLNSEKCHFFFIIIIYILRTKKTNLVKRLPVQKMKHKFCNRINIVLCLFSIFSKQQSVFYKHFFNVVYYLELILAKMCLIFKVWFLVIYIIFFNSQIMTNECTQLLTDHAFKTTQNW